MAAGDGKCQPHRRQMLSLEFVKIYAKDSTEPIQVHKSIVTQSSEFLKLALSGTFKEAEGEIRMPEHDRDVLQAYVHWLYFEEIAGVDTMEPGAKGWSGWTQLFDQYILADRLRDTTYADAIMDFLIDNMVRSQQWPASMAKRAYEELPASSPYRKLVVDCWAFGSTAEVFRSDYGDTIDGPADFWISVAETLRKHVLVGGGEWPSTATRCKYHYHEEGKSCS